MSAPDPNEHDTIRRCRGHRSSSSVATVRDDAVQADPRLPPAHQCSPETLPRGPRGRSPTPRTGRAWSCTASRRSTGTGRWRRCSTTSRAATPLDGEDPLGRQDASLRPSRLPRHALPGRLFINIVRDGRDVARSHRDTWGYVSGLKAIEKWPRYIRMAEEFAEGGPRPLPRDPVRRSSPTPRSRCARCSSSSVSPGTARSCHTEHPHDAMGATTRTPPSAAPSGASAVYRSRRRRPQGQRPAHEVVAPVAGRFHLERIGYT